MKALVLLLALTVGAAAQSRRFEWRGFYLGAQKVQTLKQPFAGGGYAITGLALVGLPGRFNKFNFNFQIIVPAGGQAPLYRIGIDRRIF